MRGSLSVTFSGLTGDPITLRDLPLLRFEGEVLRAQAGGPILAEHRVQTWEVRDGRFSRLECDGPLRVYFERANGQRSEAFGPFDSFSCVDGIAHVEHEVFAFADRAIGDWYAHRNGQHWPLMVVVPPTAL